MTHKGPKRVSVKNISKWWNELDWNEKELIHKDEPWAQLDTYERSIVRKAYDRVQGDKTDDTG